MPALAEVVGSKAIPRTEVTKKLWAYIKKNGLQDKKNKRMIKADDALKAVFGGKATGQHVRDDEAGQQARQVARTPDMADGPRFSISHDSPRVPAGILPPFPYELDAAIFPRSFCCSSAAAAPRSSTRSSGSSCCSS